MLKKLLIFLFVVIFGGALLGVGVAYWGYNYYSRDLPKFDGLNSYQPDAASMIYDSNGELIAEEYEDRRYPVHIEDVPKNVINAFLAAEDAAFYTHPGIDLMSILRAMIKNIQEGSVKQGGSTITQQVVKNLLLSNEKKLERKVKEAILAFEIENSLTKNQILELYLNQIFFGNTAYGLEAASQVYFQKPAKDLHVAEAAILAGLPQAPSRYSPVSNFDLAKQRQTYVLEQMLKHKFINESEYQEAINFPIEVKLNRAGKIRRANYYVTEVLRVFQEKWPTYDLKRDGLKVYTAVNLQAQDYARTAVRNGLREVDKRRGWMGPIDRFDLGTEDEKFKAKYSDKFAQSILPDKLYPALIKKIEGETVRVDLGHFTGTISLKDSAWAKKLLNAQDRSQWVVLNKHLRVGDVIEVSQKNTANLDKLLPDIASAEKVAIPDNSLQMDQTPKVEAALVFLNPHNGDVLATVGGYDFEQSVFNRATQALRQPGSAFKPIVYLAAVDGFKYTPSTIVYDEPRVFRVGTQVWQPANFDKTYMGAITLRVALEKSRNLVSADIMSRIGVDPVIRYAKSMGITSPMGQNLSLSLGSSEVTPLEITRAYGVFPAGGYLFDSVFIKKVVDRDGNVIYDHDEKPDLNFRQVIDEKVAFIMANMMRGVVESGTGWKVKELKRPAAGKTGTSNQHMDAWFVGYTPEFACGVWVGFDVKRIIGARETGGSAAVPIWLNFMKTFLEARDGITAQELEQAKSVNFEANPQDNPKAKIADFVPPPGLESFWVNKHTAQVVAENSPGAVLEYYLPGTKVESKSEEEEVNYWNLEE